MKIHVIGDVHGKTNEYCNLLKRIPEGERSFQLGDMGLGFKGVGLPPPGQSAPNPDFHKFIRGNHDSPEKCRQNPQYIGDWGYHTGYSLFWIAGASSIDRDMRIEGISWWRDEELDDRTFKMVYDLYVSKQPRFVFSHECPIKANQVLLYDLMGPYFFAKQQLQASRTCAALQGLLDAWAPEEWIFGHYHVDKEFKVPGYRTKFRCVGELSTYELEVGNGVL